jgi:SAM-dependent methyltransferase
MTDYLKKAWQKHSKLLTGYLLKKYNIRNKNPPSAIINNIVHNSMIDKDKMKHINTILSRYPLRDKKDNIRVDDRANSIIDIIPTRKYASYVDYGCGNGSITLNVAKRLEIPLDNVYCIEIQGGNSLITYKTPADVQYIPSNSIDLVTAIVSLHHMDSVVDVIKGIYRILSFNGMFVIREHNYNYDTDTYNLLQAVHIVSGAEPDAVYRSREEWTGMIVSCGFIEYKYTTYDVYNPQHLYWASYTKK